MALRRRTRHKFSGSGAVPVDSASGAALARRQGKAAGLLLRQLPMLAVLQRGLARGGGGLWQGLLVSRRGGSLVRRRPAYGEDPGRALIVWVESRGAFHFARLHPRKLRRVGGHFGISEVAAYFFAADLPLFLRDCSTR